MDTKAKRRAVLFADALDALLRAGCQFAMCPGPFRPLIHMAKCYRCDVVYRAWRSGLLKREGDVFEVVRP